MRYNIYIDKTFFKNLILTIRRRNKSKKNAKKKFSKSKRLKLQSRKPIKGFYFMAMKF